MYGYDTCLWDCAILAELLHLNFGVWVSERTISRHLRKLDLSYQKPQYRAAEQDPEEIRYFLEEKFPRIQRLAKKLDAEIAFEDETGVGVSTRHGWTWGERGKTPQVPASDQRGGYNVLSTVSAEGNLRYSATEEHINSQRFIAFLKQLIRGRTRPLILVLDRASFHGLEVGARFCSSSSNTDSSFLSATPIRQNTIRMNRFGTKSRSIKLVNSQ